jgi:GNAT superfamily N-acetyltransferase
MQIRKYQKSDSLDAARLIAKTFSEYNFREGSKKAVKTYTTRYSQPKKELVEMFERTPIFFVAIENSKIVGIVRGVKGRLVNLFVDGKHHGKGIGKKLLNKFEEKAISEKNTINVKASIFAIQFYQKMGYKKTTSIRNMRGLKVQPMKKIFGNQQK